MPDAGLIDSLGKLSIEVVAIGTLAYMVWNQGRGHEKMSRSIDKLTIALTKKFNRDTNASKSLKKSIDDIDSTLKSHRTWSENAVSMLKKNTRGFTSPTKKAKI